MKERKLAIAFAVIFALQIITVGLYGKNVYDQILSRQMLDARGQIQIIHFTALSEGRTLTAEEMQIVRRLWNQAEYNQVSPPPPKEK